MRVVAKRTLREYGEREPRALKPLLSWYHEVKKVQWLTPSDVKEMYRNASILKGGRVVFNVAGNNHRLVTDINYRSGTIFIKFIGTHAEYDQINAEEI